MVVEIGSWGVLLLCDGWMVVAGQRCKVGPVGLSEWVQF